MSNFGDQLRQLTEASNREFQAKQEAERKAKEEELRVQNEKHTRALGIAKAFVLNELLTAASIKPKLFEAAKNKQSSFEICSYTTRNKYGYHCTQFACDSFCSTSPLYCPNLAQVGHGYGINADDVFNSINVDTLLSQLSAELGVKVYKKITDQNKGYMFSIIADWSQQ